MTAQEIHKTLKLLKIKNEEILELQEQITAEAANVKNLSWDSPKVTNRNCTTPQERYLDRTERLNKKLNKVEAEYDDLHYKLLDLMKSLDSFYWTVIFDRFFRGMSIERIANNIGYSSDYIKKCQAAAIKKMSEFSEASPPK